MLLLGDSMRGDTLSRSSSILLRISSAEKYVFGGSVVSGLIL